MTADELLAAWALEKFRANELYQYNHLYSCPDAKATIKDSGWECGCYSDVTRDDDWHVEAVISCTHDESLETVWYSGSTNLPTIIDEMMDLDRERFTCRFEHLDGE